MNDFPKTLELEWSAVFSDGFEELASFGYRHRERTPYFVEHVFGHSINHRDYGITVEADVCKFYNHFTNFYQIVKISISVYKFYRFKE